MISLISYSSVATIPGAARWTYETNLAFILCAALALLIPFYKASAHDRYLVASAAALLLAFAAV